MVKVMAEHFHVPPPVLDRMSLSQVMALLRKESRSEQMERRTGMTPAELLERGAEAFARTDAGVRAQRVAVEAAADPTVMVQRLVGKIGRRRQARAAERSKTNGD